MSFFTQAYLDFFLELSANNHKEWFDANRQRYEQHVKKPFELFVARLIAGTQAIDPRIQIQPRDAIFRINRDIRFSADKTPYKTNRSAVIGLGGRRQYDIPGYYIQLGPDYLWIGGGLYGMDKALLGRARSNMAAEPGAIDALLAQPAFKKYYGGQLLGEKSKVLPRAYKELADRQPLLYHKYWYYMAELKDTSPMLAPDFDQLVLIHFAAGREVNAYLESLVAAE